MKNKEIFEEFKSLLETFEEDSIPMQKMLIITAKGQQNNVNEVGSALNCYRKKSGYKDRIERLISQLCKESDIFADFFKNYSKSYEGNNINSNSNSNKSFEKNNSIYEVNSNNNFEKNNTNNNYEVNSNNNYEKNSKTFSSEQFKDSSFYKKSENKNFAKIAKVTKDELENILIIPPILTYFNLKTSKESLLINKVLFSESEIKKRKLMFDSDPKKRNLMFDPEINDIKTEKNYETIEIPNFKVEENENPAKKQKIENFEFLFKKLLCEQCGLRFDEEDEQVLLAHLADHARFNKGLADKQHICREYFPDEDRYLVEEIDLDLPSIESDDDAKIFVDKKIVFCEICKERLRIEWDEAQEKWCLFEGVELNSERSNYCHRKCVL